MPETAANNTAVGIKRFRLFLKSPILTVHQSACRCLRVPASVRVVLAVGPVARPSSRSSLFRSAGSSSPGPVAPWRISRPHGSADRRIAARGQYPVIDWLFIHKVPTRPCRTTSRRLRSVVAFFRRPRLMRGLITSGASPLRQVAELGHLLLRGRAFIISITRLARRPGSHTRPKVFCPGSAPMAQN